RDGTVRWWDIDEGKELAILKDQTPDLHCVAVHSDGMRVLVSGQRDYSLVVWNPATGEFRGKFAGHAGPVLAVALSPDGRQVLTGSSDRTMRLWDWTTQKEVRRFEGHAGYVRGVAWSPDGARALSAGYDHTARVWELG